MGDAAFSVGQDPPFARVFGGDATRVLHGSIERLGRSTVFVTWT